MKKLLSLSVLCMFLSFHGFSQDINFGKFLGSINTNKFIGNSRYKLYEKQVEIIEATTSGQSRSTTLTFKFNPCSATADFLAHTQSGQKISKGQITTIENPNSQVGINHIKQIIYFEDATIVSCNDTRACNGNMATTVVLKPQRICWTYYVYDISGKLSPITSNGFDLKTGQPWTVTTPNF